MTNENQNQLFAWVEIWNPELEVVIETVKEPCPSGIEAIQQFAELNKIISEMPSETSGLILETDRGLMRFPIKFLASSILNLRVENSNNEE